MLERWSSGVLECWETHFRPLHQHSSAPLLHVFMILLLDIGNTHTHLGLTSSSRVSRTKNILNSSWTEGKAGSVVRKFAGRAAPEGVALCSVVPGVTPLVR